MCLCWASLHRELEPSKDKGEDEQWGEGEVPLETCDLKGKRCVFLSSCEEEESF